VLQAGYARDEALLERVTSEWQLTLIQAAIAKLVAGKLEAERARGGAAVDMLAAAAAQLQREALCASTLFNDFAVVRPRPPRMHGAASRAVHVDARPYGAEAAAVGHRAATDELRQAHA
jgi:hypothetical protein